MHQRIASLLVCLAAWPALAQQKRPNFTEIEERYRSKLAELERASPQDELAIAGALQQLGLVLREDGRYAEAEQDLRKALLTFELASGPGAPETAAALTDLGAILISQLKFDEAAQALR